MTEQQAGPMSDEQDGQDVTVTDQAETEGAPEGTEEVAAAPVDEAVTSEEPAAVEEAVASEEPAAVEAPAEVVAEAAPEPVAP